MSDHRHDEHGHDHDHDHGPGHKHKHEPKQSDVPARAASAPPPGPAPLPEPEQVEDASTQALSEALRSSFVIVKVIMILLVVVFFASGVFTVPSQENAIILRFGKPVGAGDDMLTGTGLKWSFPYPIDEVVRIPIGKLQQVTSTAGWYSTTPEMEASRTEPEPGPTLSPVADGYTLTSDANIIHARATLYYRIDKPLNYALNFVNSSNMVQNILDNALFHASAHFEVDEAIRDVLRFQEMVLSRVRLLVDQQALGILIERVEVRTMPPRQVLPQFAAVLNAHQEQSQTNLQAQAYANRILSTALGDSNAVVNAGFTDKARIIQEAAAEARYFTNQLTYFRRSPELFKDRVQMEMLYRVFTNAALDKNVLINSDDGKPGELRLNLSRETQRPQPQGQR